MQDITVLNYNCLQLPFYMARYNSALAPKATWTYTPSLAPPLPFWGFILPLPRIHPVSPYLDLTPSCLRAILPLLGATASYLLVTLPSSVTPVPHVYPHAYHLCYYH